MNQNLLNNHLINKTLTTNVSELFNENTLSLTATLTLIVLGTAYIKARFHPASSLNIDYNDPMSLYAFLNQNCGTKYIPVTENMGRKLVPQFSGSEVEHFISKYKNILPNHGEGLIEAQDTLTNSGLMWTIGRTGPPVEPSQTFTSYFIQDAQITGLLQASNDSYNLGIYNLAVDAGLLGATIIGVPLACYFCSDILIGLSSTCDFTILNPFSLHGFTWWGSAFASFSLLKSVTSFSAYALITPIKMLKYLSWGVHHCEPLTVGLTSLYENGIVDSIKNPLVIENNLIYYRNSFGYSPLISQFLTKTEFIAPLKSGAQSLFMLSNLGWEISSSYVITENANLINDSISNLKQLK